MLIEPFATYYYISFSDAIWVAWDNTTLDTFFRLPVKIQAWALYKYCLWQQLLSRYRKCIIFGMGTSQPIILDANPPVTSQVLTCGQNLKFMKETKVPSIGKTMALVCEANYRSIFSQDPVATMSNMDLISGSRFGTLNLEIKNVLSCSVLIYRNFLIRFVNNTVLEIYDVYEL